MDAAVAEATKAALPAELLAVLAVASVVRVGAVAAVWAAAAVAPGTGASVKERMAGVAAAMAMAALRVVAAVPDHRVVAAVSTAAPTVATAAQQAAAEQLVGTGRERRSNAPSTCTRPSRKHHRSPCMPVLTRRRRSPCAQTSSTGCQPSRHRRSHLRWDSTSHRKPRSSRWVARMSPRKLRATVVAVEAPPQPPGSIRDCRRACDPSRPAWQNSRARRQVGPV